MDEILQQRPLRRRYYQGRDLARAVSIGDLRAMASRRLPVFVREYLEGGAEDEETLRLNRAAFSAIRFAPLTLVDIGKRDLAVSLFGKSMAMPVMIGPTGFNGLFWRDGDLALANAAATAGIPFAQSTVSTLPIERVAAVDGLRHWMQLYVFGSDAMCERIVARALAAGSEALVVTTDGPLFGNREWDRRHYIGPAQLALRGKLDALRHPSWLLRMARDGLPRLENLLEFAPPEARDLVSMARWAQGSMRADLDWGWFANLRKAWPRKLIIKGVLNVADIERAQRAGADGIVLSNHGGRQLDSAISPMEILKEARRRAGPDFTILIDSGFRRGADVVKALCLGANAILLGRATLYGLAAGGEAGVARALAIFREEISRALGLLGARSIADLSPEMLAS